MQKINSLYGFLLLTALSLSLSGCAATIVNKTQTQYLDPDFDARSLRAGGLSLLPILAGQGREGYRRPLADWLEMYLEQAVPNGNSYGWRLSMERINEADKSDLYADIINGYRATSILNRKKVRLLAGALRTRYAMLCILQDFSETTSLNYNSFSGKVHQEKKANVELQCLVIDMIRGDVVQEIRGRVGSTAMEFIYNPDYEKYAQALARNVLARLPGSTVKNAKKRYR